MGSICRDPLRITLWEAVVVICLVLWLLLSIEEGTKEKCLLVKTISFSRLLQRDFFSSSSPWGTILFDSVFKNSEKKACEEETLLFCLKLVKLNPFLGILFLVLSSWPNNPGLRTITSIGFCSSSSSSSSFDDVGWWFVTNLYTSVYVCL